MKRRSQSGFRRKWRRWVKRRPARETANLRLTLGPFPPPFRRLPPLTRYWLGVCRSSQGVIFAPGPSRRRNRLNLVTVAERHIEEEAIRDKTADMSGMAAATYAMEMIRLRKTATTTIAMSTAASSVFVIRSDD